MNLPATEKILIYDASCPFCCRVASYLKKHYDIAILPNDGKLPDGIKYEAVKRDVHYLKFRHSGFPRVVDYVGAEAAVQIISDKHPVLAKLYYWPIVRQVANICYYIVKKSRKYL